MGKSELERKTEMADSGPKGAAAGSGEPQILWACETSEGGPCEHPEAPTKPDEAPGPHFIGAG